MGRRRAVWALAGALLLAPAAADPAGARTWYVRAGSSDGIGTKRAPFAGLAAVESRSRPGDRIVLLRADQPLDGGIALKPRQVLVGSRTRVTNTTERLHGDAVRLADGAVVRGLDIVGARRGGIYGLDVTRATVTDNDVSGHNASCTPGFHIPPFNVPTTVPGQGIPISDGLHNGWAGIMVDVTRGKAKLGIRGNHVHHADCGDGIDVRASGTAVVRATIDGNHVRELRQGSGFESVLAFGLQTRDTARLVAGLDRNRQSGLGNDEDAGAGPEGADSEGIFINPVDRSTMRVKVRRNTYEHTPGRGGFSANGLEFVSMGDGPSALVHVSDSTFEDTPGDVIEQLALGTGATLRLRLDRVVARNSTGHFGSGVGDTVVIPGNNADCLIGASGGARNTVELIVRRSTLTGCANNGITFGSAVANGSGPTTELQLHVADSVVTGNHGANLRVGNLSELERLSVKVERTNLSGSRGTGSSPANLTVEELGTTGQAVIDVSGGNCLTGGALAAAVIGYEVIARDNWWGTPGGPAPGRTATAAGSIDAGAPRTAPPSGC